LKARWPRRLTALLLVGALVQPSAGAALVGVFAHYLYAGAHDHDVRLVMDGGHLDVVLSHPEAPSAPGTDAAVPSLARSSADHVFHVSAAEPSAAARRGDVAPPALAVATALPPATAVVSHGVLRPFRLPASHRSDLFLRTVVLRL
jgi:hypothetical protein